MKGILIAECRRFAIELLNTYGEFYPFGFALLEDGKTVVSLAPEMESDYPTSNAVLESLKRNFQILYKIKTTFSKL
jgi:hypothetical protein